MNNQDQEGPGDYPHPKKSYTVTISQNTAFFVVGLLSYMWGKKVGRVYGRQEAFRDIKTLAPKPPL